MALTESTSSQRDDGKANIQLQYRLRGYTTTATASNNGAGEGRRFQIEGLVVRDGDDPGKGYLARTLLLRSLYVNSIVAGEGIGRCWQAKHYRWETPKFLIEMEHQADFKVLLNVNSADRYLTANGCLPYNLLEDVGSQQHK